MNPWTPRTTVAAVIETDGRFLMVQPEPEDWETPNEINIVLNWTKELEERAAPEQ